MTDELEGRRLTAMSRYTARARAESAELRSVQGGRPAAPLALEWLAPARTLDAIDWLQAATAREHDRLRDGYYLGLALTAPDGRATRAAPGSGAAVSSDTAAATLQLARLLARRDLWTRRCGRSKRTPHRVASRRCRGALEVALLRRLGREAEARERALTGGTVDPTSSVLRYELTRSGSRIPDLWAHLGATPIVCSTSSDQYLPIGDTPMRSAVLDAPIQGRGARREAGAVTPRESPLVAYYRGYVRS